jgi:hypothetical protein
MNGRSMPAALPCVTWRFYSKPRKHMAIHKFKAGQRVVYHSPRKSIGPTIFTVLRRLPTEGDGFTYRIKSTEEGSERVASEHELTSLNTETS